MAFSAKSFLIIVIVCHAMESAGGEDVAAEAVEKLGEAFNKFSQKVDSMFRQVIQQQLFLEEKIRSDADSGVKQVRMTHSGTRKYHEPSHTGTSSVLSIHEHANNDRTVGMGEFIAVLNGVEFRTRHNDYRLYMPHTTSGEYRATERIPFPDVPPEVLNKPTVPEQITEMREWFKAWRDQNNTVRDYTKYFKPVLCYLEGTWTTSVSGEIDEPFESDRHFVDASSWFDLHEKNRFMSYTGRKDTLENLAYLPTTLINITEDGDPQFAQWNYRILCHPLKDDLPLNRFRVVDDLMARVAGKRTYYTFPKTRSARFELNPKDTDTWKDESNNKKWGLLDELMEQIPGMDNYQADLEDEVSGVSAQSKDPNKPAGTTLNAGYYHRWFSVNRRDAMGISTRTRGFADGNLFMAMTTQPKVAGITLTSCNKQGKNCNYLHQKWSYAVPLEIIYTTPLSNWNPHNLEHKGEESTAYGKTVFADGRNGGLTVETAYNGTNSRKYYRTPVEFFIGNEVSTDAADTTRGVVGVLDRNGEMHKVKASGHRILFPYIPGVGSLRQRYPVMPVHGEGSAVWKELEAVKDVLLQSSKYAFALREGLAGGSPPIDTTDKDVLLALGDCRKENVAVHHHEITIHSWQADYLKRQKGQLTFETSQGLGHNHNVKVKYNANIDTFQIQSCDDTDVESASWLFCFDWHPRNLAEIENS